ncbi:unnamed protein product (mitochondrion) [Plasmodiophora brassicae]|nr:unnamed protein product [Plasmodiophora brassicae]
MDGAVAHAGASLSSERAILDALRSIEATVDQLDVSIEAIDMKLREWVASRDPKANVVLAAPVTAAVARPPTPGSKDRKAGPSSADAGKKAFEALKDVMRSIPSRYVTVDTVYDEVKAFVALNVALVDNITPHLILSENLLPYLRASSSSVGQPSLHSRIWGDMLTVAGVSAQDTKRAMKRLIDTYYRSLKRKPSPIDSVPPSMLGLADTLRSGCLTEHKHADDALEPAALPNVIQ